MRASAVKRGTDHKPPQDHYDDFYRHGGWDYNLRSEALFLHYRVLQPLGIESGTALEIGCGTGLHSEALRLLIGDAHGVDTSAVAIELARKQFPEVRFTHGDALEVLRKSQDLDVVFSRGMSWFHYELEEGSSPFALDDLMREAMNRLVEGGHFVLQVRTDFSGGVDVETGIRHHRVSQLRNWASRYGRLRLLTDWMGLPLSSDEEGEASGRNSIVCLQKDSAKPSAKARKSAIVEDGCSKQIL